MPEYVAENEAIEGKKILCAFEDRASFGVERTSKRRQIKITGNPASATLTQVWEYRHS